MSYPTTIDSIPEPSADSPTNNPSASGVSTAQTNAIVAIETKLGTGASTPVAGNVLTSTADGTSEWGATGTGNVSNTGTPTSGQIAQWTGSTVIQGLSTTGSGNVVLATSPTLVTPALGTPASGVATNLTGTASGLTTGNVTTNANLTGPITSSGNATSIASQTGTGSKFVVDTSPTIVTPTIVENANPVMSLNGNPVWQYLNSANYTGGTVTSTGATPTLVTNLTINVTIPSGCTAVRITIDGDRIYPQSGSANVHLDIYSGATSGALTTQVGGTSANSAPDATAYNSPAHASITIKSPAAGSIWYSAAISASASNAQLPTSASRPATIVVECC